MNYKIKNKLITRNKKYDYKVFEEERSNSTIGYEYSYTIFNYNENYVIESGLINWQSVEEVLMKLKKEKKLEV